MARQYEYEFVRPGEGWLSVRCGAREYRKQIHEHALQGWRLVQIFAPGLGIHGQPRFFELIFEREVAE